MIQVAESARIPCAESIAGLCNPCVLFPASFTCTYAEIWVMSSMQHAQGLPLTVQCCKLLSSPTEKRKHRKNQKGEEQLVVQGLGGHGANRTVPVLWLSNEGQNWLCLLLMAWDHGPVFIHRQIFYAFSISKSLLCWSEQFLHGDLMTMPACLCFH